MQGTVTLIGDAGPVHGALVLVVGTGATVLTEEDGTFEIPNVPIGAYEVLAQREHLTAGRQPISVVAGEGRDGRLRAGPVAGARGRDGHPPRPAGRSPRSRRSTQ